MAITQRRQWISARSAILVTGLAVGSLACLGLETASPLATALVASICTDDAEYDVDMVHSTLNFRIRHFGVSYFCGQIVKPQGTFLLNTADPSKNSVEITAEVANMNAGDENRNKFLLSPDFFNAREFPSTTFKSTAVKRIDASTWEATGDFTLHGVTKPITVRLTEYTQSPNAIPKFGFRAGFLATFTIKRSDFKVDMYVKDNVLGDEVQIIAAIEGGHA